MTATCAKSRKKDFGQSSGREVTATEGTEDYSREKLSGKQIVNSVQNPMIFIGNLK
jgi:hypothetical protein